MFKIGSLEFDRPLILAPMEDYTDQPFRRLCRQHGADIVYTEFISAEGLVRESRRTRDKMSIGPEDHPVAIQIYGNTESSLVEAASIACAMEPDFIDLNFGCPSRKVAVKKSGIGAGAGLLRDPDLLVSLTRAVVRAVPIPVSVKTRLGWDDSSIIIEDLGRRLEDTGVAAIALHARTRNQGYRGQADWSWIARLKRRVGVPVIGNGDIREPADAVRMFDETGCDAVMVGRASIGNPWIFGRIRSVLETGVDPGPTGMETRIETFLGMLESSVALKGEPRGVLEMRKHIGGYLREMHCVALLRAKLMQESTCQGVRDRIREYLRFISGGRPVWGCEVDPEEEALRQVRPRVMET